MSLRIYGLPASRTFRCLWAAEERGPRLRERSLQLQGPGDQGSGLPRDQPQRHDPRARRRRLQPLRVAGDQLLPRAKVRPAAARRRARRGAGAAVDALGGDRVRAAHRQLVLPHADAAPRRARSPRSPPTPRPSCPGACRYSTTRSPDATTSSAASSRWPTSTSPPCSSAPRSSGSTPTRTSRPGTRAALPARRRNARSPCGKRRRPPDAMAFDIEHQLAVFRRGADELLVESELAEKLAARAAAAHQGGLRPDRARPAPRPHRPVQQAAAAAGPRPPHHLPDRRLHRPDRRPDRAQRDAPGALARGDRGQRQDLHRPGVPDPRPREDRGRVQLEVAVAARAPTA